MDLIAVEHFFLLQKEIFDTVQCLFIVSSDKVGVLNCT